MLRPVPIPAVNVQGPGLPGGYAEAIAASRPAAWWRMDDTHDRRVEDATGRKNAAVCEPGVFLGPPDDSPGNADEKLGPRAACFLGGRLKASIEKLSDAYSVEFWFWNTLPITARPITGYIFSRGLDGPEGTPGDDLGISGTSVLDTVPPGRLFFYNGDAAKQAVGKTEVAPETWHHVVLVRDGKRVTAYLDGGAEPEISGEMERGYPEGVTQLFIGGRNDNFAGFQGRIAEVSVYDRALTREEAFCHHAAGRLPAAGVKAVKLPARSPNLNAHAERFVLSVETECLSRMILFGEASLRRALSQFLEHYLGGRSHQGKDNQILFPEKSANGARAGQVKCRERLGGLLNFYYRQAG